MHRIDNASAASAKPTPKPAGPDGFFTVANIAVGQQATIVEADWLNSVQEELVYIVQRGGLSLDKTNNTQILRALSYLFTGAWQNVGTTRDLLVPSWATQIVFVLVAGGGGGAYAQSDGTTHRAGAGGGAGGAIEAQRDVVPGEVVHVIIGAGGASDTAGLSSSIAFGTEWSVTCTGGGPGAWFDAGTTSSGGAGGTAYGDETLGDILISSTWGGDGQAANVVLFGNGGGGGGLWGGGGRAGAVQGGGGLPGGGPGSGGGGAYDITSSNVHVGGGRGANGILRYRFLP